MSEKLSIEIFRDQTVQFSDIEVATAGIARVQEIAPEYEIGPRDRIVHLLGGSTLQSSDVKRSMNTDHTFAICLTNRLLSMEKANPFGIAYVNKRVAVVSLANALMDHDVTVAHELGHLSHIRYGQDSHCEDYRCIMYKTPTPYVTTQLAQEAGIRARLVRVGMLRQREVVTHHDTPNTFCAECEEQIGQTAYDLRNQD